MQVQIISYERKIEFSSAVQQIKARFVLLKHKLTRNLNFLAQIDRFNCKSTVFDTT